MYTSCSCFTEVFFAVRLQSTYFLTQQSFHPSWKALQLSVMGTGLWSKDQELWVPCWGLSQAPRSALGAFTPHKAFNCYLFPPESCQISQLPLAAGAIAVISSCARSISAWLLCWSKDPLLPSFPSGQDSQGTWAELSHSCPSPCPAWQSSGLQLGAEQ